MNFTYENYRKLLATIEAHNYKIANYHNWKNYERCVILRHDIDYDLGKAVELAKVEQDEGISSTYFVLVVSDFYNVFSFQSREYLDQIADCGHEIGLHFDEVRYPGVGLEGIKRKIIEECELLGKAAGQKITTVSMHRPSNEVLNADLQISGIINSYCNQFFHEFKYLSDSRRSWREPIDEIISSEQYSRLHILTHAFWYNEVENGLKESLLAFINNGNMNRYGILQQNFTRLSDEVKVNEVN